MNKKNKNSGFSLIELILAIAVLAFLMLAVSSFMGSSVMQSKKTKADVRLQAQAQETYSLITDTIMQASDIIIGGYTDTSDPDQALDFAETGKEVTAGLTKKYYVKDKAVADAIVANPAAYGISDSVIASDIVYFTDVPTDTKIHVTYLRVESAVPIDMNQVPSGNPNITSSQMIYNSLLGTDVKVDCELVGSKKVYSVNDTLVSTFYFKGENLYYGRNYAFMTDLNDVVDMSDDDSKKTHLYSKYFSYVTADDGTLKRDVSGCVATVNANDGTVGIDLYYNKANMAYTTLGRINTRNSYVLKPRK